MESSPDQQGTQGTPPVSVPLRDGSELRVDAEGIHVGAQLYRPSQLHDARQISPDPVTIGLRVEGSGLIKLVPTRTGDAAVALEAIYRYRPDLRPPTVAAPWPYGPPQPLYGPPGYPPFPLYGPPPPYPPGFVPAAYGPLGYPPPPPGYPPPPGGYGPPPPGYSIVPPGGVPPATPPGPYGGGTLRGGLGPWPQGIGDVIGTSFRLYFHNFGRFALLGLAVALWPALVTGGLQVAYEWALGLNPLGGSLQQSQLFNNLSSSNPSNSFPFQMPNLSPDQIAAIVTGSIFVPILLLVLGAWQTGALATGARESVLGRPVSVGAAARGGLQRFWAVLGTQVLIGLMFIGGVVLLALVVGLLVFGVGALAAAASGSSSGTDTTTSAALFLAFCGATLLYIGAIVVFVYFAIRLGLAPYAAASDRLSPGRAIARSWTLTGGNWWRTFLPILVAGLAVGLVTAPFSTTISLFSLAVAYLLVVPIVTAIAAPLTAVTYMVIYYDLRLRKEGFPALAMELDLIGARQAPPTPAAAPPPGMAGPTAPPPPGGPAHPGQPS